MKKNHFISLIAFLSLGLAALACTVNAGGPAYPETSIPVSTESVSGFKEQIEAAQTAAVQGGVLSISISESQLTSLVAAKLEGDTSPSISDPQIYLRDGQIQVYGKTQQGPIQVNLRIVIAAGIDANGQPDLSVVSADFGPLPAPAGLNQAMTSLVQEAFTGGLGPAAIGFRLESITIADGNMILSGRIK